MTLAIAFDTETTGLLKNKSLPDKHQPEIISFYGCIFETDDGKIIDERSYLWKPRYPISEEITRINGHTNEEVANCKPFGDDAKSLFEWLANPIDKWAHNCAFDWGMLQLEFLRNNLILKSKSGYKCTVEKTMHLQGYRQSLTNLHKLLFGEEFDGAHNAKADVLALVRCIVELKKRGIV